MGAYGHEEKVEIGRPWVLSLQKGSFREGGRSLKQKRFPRWLRKLFRRRMLIAFLIIAQAAFIICLVASGSMVSRRLSRLLQIISILVVLYIVSKRDKGAYKTLWVFLILCFPIFGGLLYLLVTCQTTTRLMRRDIQNVQKKTKDLYNLPGDSYYRRRQSGRPYRYASGCPGSFRRLCTSEGSHARAGKETVANRIRTSKTQITQVNRGDLRCIYVILGKRNPT